MKRRLYQKTNLSSRLGQSRTGTFALLLVFLSLACFVPAQVPPPIAPQPALNPAVPPPPGIPGQIAPLTPAAAAPGRGAAAMAGFSSQTSTNKLKMKAPQLKYVQATLDMVLNDYSQATGRTLLMDPKVPAPAKGITLSNEGDLNFEEYLQALETVLAMNGIGLVKTGEKFLKVVPITDVRSEGMDIRDVEPANSLKENDELVSQMVQLKSIDVNEAMKIIDTLKFHHAYGKINVFERTNCILITDTSANISRILDVMKYIDQPIEAREVPTVIQIRSAKASLIKTKLEEIIADSQKEQSTIPKMKTSGSPGVVAPAAQPAFTPPLPPGVIRPTIARPTPATPSTATETVGNFLDEAERGIIRGKVKIVADDRTNILIIITRPENMKFFEKIVNVLDVPTDPDVQVKVIRLEFADADQVASMINTLIGAQQQNKESAKAGIAGGKPETTAEPGKESRSTALETFARQQQEAMSKVADSEGVKSKVGELSAQNIKILADKRTNALHIMASRTDLRTLEEIIKAMDIAVSQVMIEVLILDVRLSNEIQTGVDWIQRSLVAYNKNSDGSRKPIVGFAGGGGGGDPGFGQIAPTTLGNFSSQFPGAGLTYYMTYFGLSADMVAKMVASDGRSRVISSPVIVTTDNKKAQLDVTSDNYFYKGQNYVSTGVGSYNPVDNVDMKSVGIKLTVTPHINMKNNVQMEISQEISDATGKQKIGKDAVEWPIMSVNKFEATVSVRSGMTIVLGGLANENKSLQRSKIPILGDLPLIGLLFGSSGSKKDRHEILVFLTPYVMDSSDDIEADAVRRQRALGPDGKWTRGWSNSKLGDPSKEELKDLEIKDRENQKQAKKAAAHAEAVARAAALEKVVPEEKTAPVPEPVMKVDKPVILQKEDPPPAVKTLPEGNDINVATNAVPVKVTVPAPAVTNPVPAAVTPVPAPVVTNPVPAAVTPAPAAVADKANATTATNENQAVKGTVPAAGGNKVVKGKTTEAVDPAIAAFIKRNEKKYERNLKKVDQRVQQELGQAESEKKP